MKITLCGSTRFLEAFGDWNVILTMAGHIVYTVCTSFKGDFIKGINKGPQNIDDKDETKRRFDLIHLEKISQSDAILVLNVDGYYGDSTTREIEWARMQGKQIFWLNNSVPGRFLGTSIWSIYNLFDNVPIIQTKGAEKYARD